MQLISSTSSTGFTAAVGNAIGTSIDSVWVMVVLAISIPLAFYVIHRVIGLFPKSRK